MNIIVTSYDTNQEFVFYKQIKITQTISNKNDNMFTLVVYFKRMRYLWKSDCFIKCKHWNALNDLLNMIKEVK